VSNAPNRQILKSMPKLSLEAIVFCFLSVWNWLSKEIYWLGTPKTKDRLIQSIAHAWQRLSQEFVRNAIDAIKPRLRLIHCQRRRTHREIPAIIVRLVNFSSGDCWLYCCVSLRQFVCIICDLRWLANSETQPPTIPFTTK
jgi:hypothetical protein